MTGRIPRVVLDTNAVVSALLFSGGPAGRLRGGWQSGRFIPLGSRATTSELVRVLAYRKFRLTIADQEELLADWLPWVAVVRIPEPLPSVPACRDPRDVPFLHLAVHGNADVLVSGDKDLLELAGTRELCPVIAVDAFCVRYLG